MNITSLKFILLIGITLIAYYAVPKKFQWVILLLSSGVFYCYSGIKPAIFVLFTATTIFIATNLIDIVSQKQNDYFANNKQNISKDEKKKIKHKNQITKKTIMITALLINIGILCTTKYLHFLIDQINNIFSFFGDGLYINNAFDLIIPLGISFYTFQAVGYLLDVYWEKITPEKNYFKFLLFVSFFPQMTQGPISDYNQLSKELFSWHTFTYKNYSYGMQRLLWGFTKKLLVANIAGKYVSNLFTNYESYTGITTLLGVFFYSIQIYADFSGYMDIMCGYCETLGIHLRENFDRPYFSKSIAEYWRRWHMSLGDWFKNYLYYPIGMSNWNRKLSKKVKSKFGNRLANTIPATVALIIVWTTTGLWHGANWAYIVWGLVNGLFIILSMWLEPVYIRIKYIFHINDSKRIYKYFQIIRTFVLVSLIKILPEVGELKDGIKLICHIFTNHQIPKDINHLLEFAFLDISKLWLYVCLVLVLVIFYISANKNRFDVREKINKLNPVVRVVVLSLFIVLAVSLGVSALYEFGGGGFMYAGF